MLLGVAGNCNGAIAQMLKNTLLNGKREREIGSLSSQESMITLREKSGELCKVNVKLRENYLRLKLRRIR